MTAALSPEDAGWIAGGEAEPEPPRAPGRGYLYGTLALYAVCTGLNRGAILLALPFLAHSLTLAEFGLFGLTQTVVQLLPPVLGVNGSAAVEREASVDADLGNAILTRYAAITLVIGTVAWLAGLRFSTARWIPLALMLGTAESLHLLVLTWLRATGRPTFYAVVSLGKTLGLLGLIAYASAHHWTLIPLLRAQAGWYGAVAGASTIPLLVRTGAWGRAPMAAALAYTLPLIPHSAAQWVLSSSDRLIVKAMLGDAPLGLYSIAYTLGSAVLLLNSGVALSLPPHFMRNYEAWLSPRVRLRFFVVYTAIVVVAFIGVLSLVELDRHYTLRLGTYPPVLLRACGWVVAGVYLLGLYLFYTNYLFFHRRSGRIALITGVTAVVSVTATAGLIPLLGIIGPAISTFLSYAVYLALVVREARRQEPRLAAVSVPEWCLFVGSPALCVALSYAWSATW